MCQESINDYFDYGKNDIIFERYEKAIENLTKVIEFYKDNKYHSEDLFVAHYAHRIAYKNLKKDIEAMQDFEKASCFNRKSAEALHNYGICCQILFGEDDAEIFEFVFDDIELLKNGNFVI